MAELLHYTRQVVHDLATVAGNGTDEHTEGVGNGAGAYCGAGDARLRPDTIVLFGCRVGVPR